MLARVIRRRREITVRLALGVSRARLVGQFLTESLLMAMLGGAAGLFIAQWSGVAIRGLLLPEGSAFNLADDWRTISMAFACARGRDHVDGRRSGARRRAHRPRGDAQVRRHAKAHSIARDCARRSLVLQVSLSVAAARSAPALFVRSFGHARAIPLGYDAGPVLEVVADFRGLDDATGRRRRRVCRLLAAAKALPGVAYAAHVNSGLFATNTADVARAGNRLRRVRSVDSTSSSRRRTTSRSCRRASCADERCWRAIARARRSWTVVSEAMGQALWPGRDPIGQCLFVGLGERVSTTDAPCTTVVGIAENTVQQNLIDDARVHVLHADGAACARARRPCGCA